jgi:iron complex transport system substrate-binding protein
VQRKIRTLAGLLVAGSALVGCASPNSENVPSPQGHKLWSFTDDRHLTVTADAPPRRIIAQVSAAGALKDFGVDVVGTFGPLVKDDGATESEAGSLDPRRVTDVTGPGYGQINMERVTSLDADLLVSGKYAEFEGLWHLPREQEEMVKRLVPTVGIAQSGMPLPENIAKYKELARALGGDVDSPQMRADQDSFNAAAQRLRVLGARLRSEGRAILTVGGTRQEYFVVVPGRNPDLDYYVRQLGLPIVSPRNPDVVGGGYFERLSWENASAYTGDILMWDTRTASMTPQQMKDNVVFAAQPAAAQDRFVEWDAVAPLSYASYAKIMNKLADQLESKLATLK